MRICLNGPEQLVMPVARLLALAGHTVIDRMVAITVDLSSAPDGRDVEVDGIEGALETRIVRHIATLATTGSVRLRRRGGVQSDQRIAIAVPLVDLEAVGRAIARACYELERDVPSRRLSWLARLVGAGVAVVVVATSLGAAPQPVDDARAELELARQRIAQLEVQLEARVLERDHELARLQQRLGAADLTWRGTDTALRKQVLDESAARAECELSMRALIVSERWRRVDPPAPGSIFDIDRGTFIRPDPPVKEE